jgi:raffinose/stachyose/melibiose transport system permease protein
MKKNYVYPKYFYIGALVLYFFLFFFPSLIGMYYSFTDWNSFDPKINFIGFENYKKVISGKELYWFYIYNTIIFTVVTTIFKTVIGFFCALLLVNAIKLKNVHRMIIFLPQILSFVIIGLVFKSILSPSDGFLNDMLKNVGLGSFTQNWLGDIKWAFKSVMAVDTWKGAGYLMVLFIAALQSIPSTYYEAADIDGANYFQRLLHITIPLILPTIAVTLVLNITYGLRVFDSVYVLTNGGPGYATGVINTAVFKEFSKGTYGLSSALSTVLFIFLTLISYFLLKIINKKEVDFS